MFARALLPGLIAGLAMSGCGSDRPATGKREDSQAVQARVDGRIERATDRLERAASDGNVAGVQATERELDRLARRRGPSRPSPGTAAAGDPYERMLGRFRFKRGPLYVQQITSSASDHRLFVSVFRDHFCLRSLEARLAAARAVFAPADRFLRANDVLDFEFFLVPVRDTQPTTSEALAVGRSGSLTLTARGRSCR